MIINNHYEIKEFLGKGSYGAVYRCTDIFNNKKYAIKFEEFPAYSLLREQYYYRAIKNHRFMPTFYALGVCFNFPEKNKKYRYIVIEYLPYSSKIIKNVTKFKKLNKSIIKKSPQSIKLFYAKKLVRAIKTIHRIGYGHFDIYPSNLRLDEKFNLKIIDFGLAGKLQRPCKKKIKTSQGIGMMRYMGLDGHYNNCTPASDLQSCLYVAFYWLNIKMPWFNVVEKGIEKNKKILKIKKYYHRRQYKSLILKKYKNPNKILNFMYTFNF